VKQDRSPGRAAPVFPYLGLCRPVALLLGACASAANDGYGSVADLTRATSLVRLVPLADISRRCLSQKEALAKRGITILISSRFI
jgi:hypothetical protein